MLTGFVVFTLFVALIGYLSDAAVLLPISGIFLVASIVVNIIQKRRQSKIFKNWLCPSYILLFGLLVVCFQTIINISFGYANFTYYYSGVYSKFFTQVAFLGIVSVASYLLGGNLKAKQAQTEKEKSYAVIPWLITLPILFALFLVNIDLASFMSGTNYVGSGAYNRIVEKSSYFEQLLDVNIVIVTSLIAYRDLKSNKHYTFVRFIWSFPIVYWVVVLGYLFLRLLSGDRGPVLYTICLIFYAYLMVSRHRFRFITVAGIVLLAAISTSFLGSVRGGDLKKSFSERAEIAINQSNNKKSIIPSTQELANSSNTEYIAMRAINDNDKDYAWGKYSFYAILGSIPGSSYVLSNIFGVDMRKTLSSEFITITDKGVKYRYGLGTSPMAEFFLELDILGCVIGFILLGWLFKFIDIEVFTANSRTPLWVIIFVLKLSSISIYIARSSVASCVSKALYIILIFLVLNTIFSCFKKRA